MHFISQYGLIFIIFSVIGYIAEVAYCSIGQRKLVNRGFMYGPWLPIYGFGGLIVYIFLIPIKKYPILVFILALILTSIVEYIGSWILEKIFKVKLWDYSKHKFNINGRVCLLNSTLFGVMGLLMVYYLAPHIDKLIAIIPVEWKGAITELLTVLFTVDLTLSIIKMSGFKKAMAEIKEKAKETEEKIKLYAEEGRKEKESEFRAKITKEFEEFRDKAILNNQRILSAFPTATSKASDMKSQIEEARIKLLKLKEDTKRIKKESEEKLKHLKETIKK